MVNNDLMNIHVLKFGPSYDVRMERKKPGPKISIFLTLPIVTQAAYSSPSEAPVGNTGNVSFSLLQWHGNAFVTFQRF